MPWHCQSTAVPQGCTCRLRDRRLKRPAFHPMKSTHPIVLVIAPHATKRGTSPEAGGITVPAAVDDAASSGPADAGTQAGRHCRGRLRRIRDDATAVQPIGGTDRPMHAKRHIRSAASHARTARARNLQPLKMSAIELAEALLGVARHEHFAATCGTTRTSARRSRTRWRAIAFTGFRA